MRRTLTNIWLNERGQDLIEYALLAGLATIMIGAALPSTMIAPMSTIYSKVTVLLDRFGNGQG
jgi:Flp pilus assembly pilin Flp